MAAKNKGGFTLVEIMVSMVVLALLAVGFFSVMLSSRFLVARTRDRARAIELARREIEIRRPLVGADTWFLNSASDPLNPTGAWSCWTATPTVGYESRFNIANVTGSDCRRITVQVRWNETTM